MPARRGRPTGVRCHDGRAQADGFWPVTGDPAEGRLVECSPAATLLGGVHLQKPDMGAAGLGPSAEQVDDGDKLAVREGAEYDLGAFGQVWGRVPQQRFGVAWAGWATFGALDKAGVSTDEGSHLGEVAGVVRVERAQVEA